MRPCRLGFPYIPVILVLSTAMGGCAVLGNVRTGKSSVVQMEQQIKTRQEQLAELSPGAVLVAPESLGAVRALVGEMEFFGTRKDFGQVQRLDVKVGPLLDRIRDEISGIASGGNIPEKIRLQHRLTAARAEIKSLHDDLDVVNGVRESEAQASTRRLAAMEAARDNAVREVVRTRARIQGMASPAEAAAMFAEARVIIDRMNEDAFNEQAKDYLSQGRKFLQNGKKEMERQNPGGAAYLFDLISTLYESFRGIDSKVLTVNTRKVNLRAMPNSSSKKLGLLSHGEKVTGQEKKGNWILVRTTSGLRGWIHSNYLQ
ncbi:MAG: SH3 domain-containing protein [Deltaproteobacteria bacterium]|nr:SH3 domain-containing protein [Deltaproteobacteria bacterium]